MSQLISVLKLIKGTKSLPVYGQEIMRLGSFPHMSIRIQICNYNSICCKTSSLDRGTLMLQIIASDKKIYLFYFNFVLFKKAYK